jgi:hypothetical protein
MSRTQASRERRQQESVRQRAADALREGRITQAEHDYFLEREFSAMKRTQHGTQPLQDAPQARGQQVPQQGFLAGRKTAPYIAVFIVVALLGLALLPLSFDKGVTGFSVVDVTEHQNAGLTFIEPASLPLNITDTTVFGISGHLVNGSAQVYLDVAGERLLIYEGSTARRISTAMQSYALGETVSAELASVEYTLWLTAPDGTKHAVDATFTADMPGEYALDALINESGSITKESVTFLVREDTDPSRDIPRVDEVVFTDACVETCSMASTGAAPLTLVATTSPGASLTITGLKTTRQRSNSPPGLVSDIPDISVEEGQTVSVDLAAYFNDPENDPLTFDFLNAPGAGMRVDASTLYVQGITPGTSQSVIYASDTQDLAQSNTFTINVLAAEHQAMTNETAGNETSTTANETGINTTTEAVNTTSNTTETVNATSDAIEAANTTVVISPETNITTSPPPPIVAVNATTIEVNQSLSADCANPDPNLRAPECFIGKEQQYFRDDDGFIIEDKARTPVGRFNALGNLMLSGGVVEHSAGSPGPSDFSVGYRNEDGKFVSTAWIDSATGDLHLRGALFEEELSLSIPQNSYSIQSLRGINLAYFEPTTGTLHVRGNVIPYRRDIMK